MSITAKTMLCRLFSRRACLACIFFRAWVSLAQQPQPPDLSNASLEELMNVEVTSASKKEQKLSRVAAAIYVLNQEDIRRSGATSIPDLLRMVPGMDVAQVSGDSWAVSARGFNNIWANKLLVLVDGRSVYNPAFSGTFWGAQDVPLSDIERIEVIRGPGATVWGANAVNGVINIITKNSKDTTGGTIEAAAGSPVAEQALAQYGGGIGASGHYRIFGDSTLDRSNSGDLLGHSANDAGHIYHFGFRTDWALSERDSLLVEGDLSSSDVSHTYNAFYSYLPPYSGQFADISTSHDGSLLGRWTRTLSPSSDMALQFYYDHSENSLYGIHENVATADIDFQHHLAVGARNDIVWGVDARVQPGTILGGYYASFYHPTHTNWLTGAFLQDEIKLTNSISLTAGTKFEHNDYTGGNIQPSIRALWALNKRHSVWAAVSRALREPSREDVDIRFIPYATMLPNGLAGLVVLSGSPNIEAEALIAYEAGYRFEPNKRLSLDFTSFYNHYTNLIESQADGEPFLAFNSTTPYIDIPAVFTNNLRGRTYGAEVSGVINVSKRLKLSPGYSLLRSKLVPVAVADIDPYILQGDAPQHQFQFRSSLTLLTNLQWDTSLYYVSAVVDQSVPAFARLDTRLAWRISDAFELSVVGQNLADHHY
jgi:iron complex outermembrane receptor protein